MPESSTGRLQTSGDAYGRLERFGRFIVLETLGSGGAGSVHRAYDPQLDRSVAIKVLHSCEAPLRLLAEVATKTPWSCSARHWRLRSPSVAKDLHAFEQAYGRDG